MNEIGQVCFWQSIYSQSGCLIQATEFIHVGNVKKNQVI